MTTSLPQTDDWYTRFDWRILLLFVSLAILVSLYTQTYGRWFKGGILIVLIGLYYFVLYWSTHS